ncbi:elongation factor 1 (EF-1), putative [Plasmodium reichenowi]|uniref:Elongation factor 1 (EF-1), putative n=1 Tax=Plasmodium reichenowi TaxID=5854 RepID=A0A060RT62_PLARE|nr:elongation factor 1 (EF-1), putative [Plasmodium reichenowi]KYO02690.1 elongation factor 1 (EF-1), putative [Plasmodium reichenowi]CDO62620.1 elongation factor 1 (EF-1), putative [Plasmodium reichenowi]SOV75959.1 elongation factor 1 (EF-1), putative [Plasmodium reichenowi]
MANTYDELYVPLSYYILQNEGGNTSKIDQANNKKPKKKEVINKSSLIIDIKPYGENTDLDEVLKLVKNITMEGLTWGKAHKKTPFAFGLFKLQVSCVIVDDLVNTDELIETIENLGLDNEQLQKKKQMDDDEENYDEDDEIEGLVQSAEIISFNKL